MKISVNGKEKDVPELITIKTLLINMQVAPEMVACELNLNMIKRNQYDSTALRDGDQIEILQMIGGG